MSAMGRKRSSNRDAIFLSYRPPAVLAFPPNVHRTGGLSFMQLLSCPLRPRRPGEWTAGSAILFIVTLAAKGSVTLACRDAGMSRKSAYALRKRDPLFAGAWESAARAAAATASNESKKGNSSRPVGPSTSSSVSIDPPRARGSSPVRPAWHDRLLAELLQTRRDSPFGRGIPRLAPRPASR